MIVFYGSVKGQNIQYAPRLSDINYQKTINTNKPVSIIAGDIGTAQNGTATFNLPIYCSPGTNGVQPNISVTYSSQSGMGNLGMGWNVSGLSSIIRTGKNIYNDEKNTLVSYQTNNYGESDDEFMIDGSRMVSLNGQNGSNAALYSTESEALNRITCFNSTINNSNPSYFIAKAKDGSETEYGNTSNSKIKTVDGSFTNVWQISRAKDIFGNYIDFEYENTDRDFRISKIKYTGNTNTGLIPYNTIEFVYEIAQDQNETFDVISTYKSKYKVSNIIIKHINDFNIEEIIKTYKFHYTFDNDVSMLQEVEEFGGDETATSLNTTTFLYDSNTPDITFEKIEYVDGPADYFTGDYDGDGKNDLLKANTIYNPNSNSYSLHTDYTIFGNLKPTGYSGIYSRTLPQNSGIFGDEDKFFNFMASDYNGDGRDDVFEFKVTNQFVVACIDNNGFRAKLNTLNIIKTMDDPLVSNGYQPVPVSLPLPNFLGTEYHYLSKSSNFTIPGDFDGDGNQDYILLTGTLRPQLCEGLVEPFYFKAFFSSPMDGIYNAVIENFGIGSYPIAEIEHYAETIVYADKIQLIDIDGDGKSEILVVKGNFTYVLKINKIVNSIGQISFTANVINTLSEINNTTKFQIGDFNGDKKSDIFYQNNGINWTILYSYGTAFINQNFTLNKNVNFEQDKFVSADFNGDGKFDILHAYPNWINGVASTSTFDMYYSNGKNATPFVLNSLFYPRLFNSNNDFMLGDFNGDGKSDIASHINNIGGGIDLIYFKPNGKEKLLTKVINGFGVSTKLDYQSLSDNETDNNFYQRTVLQDENINAYPYNYTQLPIYALKTIKVDDGLGSENTTEFYYRDAVLHRQGKGLLGFKEVYTKNDAEDKLVKIENITNTNFAFLLNTKQTITKLSNNELLGETINDYSIADLSSTTNKRFWVKNNKTTNLDYFLNRGSETLFFYDNDANITSTTTKVGARNDFMYNPKETEIITNTWGSYNSIFLNKVLNSTITNLRNGAASLTTTDAYTYNTNGTVNTVTKFAGLTNAVNITNTYDVFGNVIALQTTATGVITNNSNTIYDSRGRFATQVTKNCGALTETGYATYDSKFGLKLSQTTNDCLTTNYSFDNFGNGTSVTTPNGKTTNFQKIWELTNSFYAPSNPNALCYQYTTYGGGKPNTKLHLDKLGREWKRETGSILNEYGEDFMGYAHTILTTYDSKGNVKTTTNSHFPASEIPIITRRNYDNYNRIYSQVSDNGTETFAYETFANGHFKVTNVDASGKTKFSISDAANKLIRVNDDGGDLFYEYDSRDKQTVVKHGTNNMVTVIYDIYGNKLSSTDMSMGTTLYEYNGKGLITKETDAKGSITQIVYDAFDRVISKISPEGTSSISYNSTGSCANHKINSMTNYNGIVTNYGYDNLSRILTETVNIPTDNINVTKQLYYDTNGQIKTISYNNNMWLTNQFDDYGYVKKVFYNQINNNPANLVYQLNNVDGEGRVANYTLGNNHITSLTYDGDFPSSSYTPNIYHMSYQFDKPSANLLTRTNVLKNQTESFTYDALDRLQQSIVNGNVQVALNYDQTGNHSFSNIVNKTDVGAYKYKNNKKNTLAYIIKNANSAIANDEQQIVYNSSLLPVSITENNNLLQFTYADDGNRIKTELIQNGNSIEKRYYFDGYEIQIANGIQRELMYIEADPGNVSIIVKEGNIITPYFTYTDYLGSINLVTEKIVFKKRSGELEGLVKEQNFDAWGRDRDPNNWDNFLAQTPYTPNSFVYRGYTGHEMLPYFALINMNARLYDPVMGMMLSPDNYVSNNKSTKAFNRYSYALNNPLKFTDPDGNFPWLAVAIGAAAGAWMGGTVENNTPNPFKWKKWGYAIGGAVIGAASGGLGFYASHISTVATVKGVSVTTVSAVAYANTINAVVSSFVSSVGMSMLTGGKVKASFNFGFGSYNMQSGKLDYLWDGDNNWKENLGFVFGAMGTLQDVVVGNNVAQYKVVADNSGEGISHSAIVDEKGSLVVSVAADDANTYKAYTGVAKDGSSGTSMGYLIRHIKAKKGAFWGSKGQGIDYLNMKGNNKWLTLNSKVMYNIKQKLDAGKGVLGGSLKYGLFYGCQNHVARSLLANGVIVSPLVLWPSQLIFQLRVREIGLILNPLINN